MDAIVYLNNDSLIAKQYIESTKNIGLKTIVVTETKYKKRTKISGLDHVINHATAFTEKNILNFVKKSQSNGINIKTIIGFSERDKKISESINKKLKLINSSSPINFSSLEYQLNLQLLMKDSPYSLLHSPNTTGEISQHFSSQEDLLRAIISQDMDLITMSEQQIKNDIKRKKQLISPIFSTPTLIIPVFIDLDKNHPVSFLYKHTELKTNMYVTTGYELLTDLKNIEIEEIEQLLEQLKEKSGIKKAFVQVMLKRISNQWKLTSILPGGMNHEINQMILLGLNRNIMEEKILFHLGEKPLHHTPLPLPTYLQYLMVEQGGTLEKITGRNKTAKLSFVHEVKTFPIKGDDIIPNTTIGYIMTKGKTQEEAKFHSILGAVDVKFHINNQKEILEQPGLRIPSDIMQQLIPTIVAITGSAGKTTTKSMIASILREKFKIFESRNSENTHRHTLQHAEILKSSLYQAAVLEYGMAYYGNIKKHCQAIQPNIAVITNIGSAHIGHFGGDVASLAKAKSEIIKGTDPNGFLFVNADDDNSRYLETKDYKGTIYTIGTKKTANYRAKNIKYTKDGMSFQVKLDQQTFTFTIPIFGIHNVYNALFAIAVSHHLGLSGEEIAMGISKMKKAKRRFNIKELEDNILLIDDCHSSNPEALKAAIDVMKEISQSENYAVIGSMLELGRYSKQAHSDVGKYITENKVDYLYTIGSLALTIHKSAIENGFPKECAIHFQDKEQLKNELKKIKENATILVKGSRKMELEEIVEFLETYYTPR